jgi:hypothetical protein
VWRLYHSDFCSDNLIDDLSDEENERAHEKWCNDLAVKFLCVFVLDRFGDFVSDQVKMYQSSDSYCIDICSTGRCASERNRLSNDGFIDVAHASSIPFTRPSNTSPDDSPRFSSRTYW